MTIPGVRGNSEVTGEDSCKLSIPLNEKVFATDVFQDQTQSLIGVGLRSSVVVIKLVLPEKDQQQISHEILFRSAHDSRVQSFSWSPETCLTSAPKCLRFATGGADHHLRLYSSELGATENGSGDTFKVLKGHTDYINDIAYQPENGAQIVSGSDDHLVTLWDARKGSRLENITFKSPVMALSWHPDEVSKLLVGEKSGVLHILNIVTYNPILSLDCGAGPLLSADWSLYNNLLVAASVMSEVIVWDLSKMAPVSKKSMRQEIVKSVKMCPFSECMMATAGQINHGVKISSFKNDYLADIVVNKPIGGISWHPSKNLLIIGQDQSVSVHHILNKMQV